MKINSVLELDQSRRGFKASLDKQYKKVIVCGGTGCVAGGAMEIYDEIKRLIEEKNLYIELEWDKEEGIGVKKSGCHGFCEAGPLVRIEPEKYLYLKVKTSDCEEIVNTTLIEGLPIERLMYKLDEKIYHTQESIPFYEGQTRLVLEHCGHIDAESIKEYIVNDGDVMHFRFNV